MSSIFKSEDLYNSRGISMGGQILLESKYDWDIALYCIADDDKEHPDTGRKIPSLKKLFIEIGDPTEYSFALQVFGSWKFWDKLRKVGIVKEALPSWHIELEIKIKSEALDKVIEVSKDLEKPNTAYQASKFLLKEYFTKKDVPTRGRPSKEEVKGELAREARVSKELQQHLERVGLKSPVIN